MQNEDGEDIIGAVVSIVGTNIGNSTDSDGRTSLSIPLYYSQFRVSATGYETTTREIIKDKAIITYDVTLQEI